MLSIGAMSGGQEAYYADLAREDYYLEGGEPPGVWWGSEGAQSLRLEGLVERKDLEAVFRGLAPSTGLALVRNAGRSDRRAGFDLTFSAPKSVSVLFALGSAELRSRVSALHAAAVRSALQYLEQKAAFTRRGAGGDEQLRASLTVAMFEHSTARALEGETPDPHLHTHCLVMNVALAADGSSGTLDGRHLFRHKMTAGALYRAELFCGLERELGLRARKHERIAELDVVPGHVREAFSKRRTSILTYLEERGLDGAVEASDAALRTRGKKPVVDRDGLARAWQEEARALGFVLDGELVYEAPPRCLDADQLAATAARAAVQELTQHASHFAEREVVRLVADRLEAEGVGARAIQQATETLFRESPEIVRLAVRSGEMRYTTREMLELERGLLAAARRLSRRRNAVSAKTVQQALEARATIRHEQAEAVRHLTQGAAIALCSGMAGTGKTFMLGAAREAFEASGARVRGAALSAAAAKALEAGSGIPSETIHQLLRRLEQSRDALWRGDVLVIDEAGMVGTRQMARLVAAVERAHAKLVLVGDERQLQAIDAGGAFARLAQELGQATLVEVTRQRDGWARRAVEELSRGEAERALRRFKERNQVLIEGDRLAAIARLVSDWNEVGRSAPLQETLVLTGTRADAALLNRAIQASRLQAQELEEAWVGVGATRFYVGDRVIFRKNSALVSNGERGVVTRASSEEGTLTVRLDGGKRVTVDLETYPHIQLGYAATTHVAQGATVRNCLALLGGATQDREASYVQASRATHATRLYVDVGSAGEELEDLVRAMERSRRKELALELLPELEPKEGEDVA